MLIRSRGDVVSVTRNGCAQPSNGTWLYHLGTIVGVFQYSPGQTVSRQLPVNVKFGRNSGIFVISAIRDECQKWSMEMIMSKSKPITLGAAIFYGGLIAGILDAADGFVAYYLAAGLNAFEKGIPGALVGLLAHFF